MSMLAVGFFALAYANRSHFYPADETWHYALTFRLARGDFPPVSPFGFDAGIGYHYGADLLAASIINVAGAFPWTTLDALSTLLVVALVVAASGFAYDVGAPLPLALGAGAAIGFFDGAAFIGYRAGYFEDLALLESPPYRQLAFEWAFLPQRAVGVICVVLVAAALQAGAAKRQAALLAAAAGILPLGNAAVMIFCRGGAGAGGRGATGPAARARAIRLRWRPDRKRIAHRAGRRADLRHAFRPRRQRGRLTRRVGARRSRPAALPEGRADAGQAGGHPAHCGSARSRPASGEAGALPF